MKLSTWFKKRSLRVLLLLPIAAGLQAGPAFAAPAPAAASTIDVCHDEASGNWRYSGVVVLTGKQLDSAAIHIDYRVQNQTSALGYADVLRAVELAPFLPPETPVRLSRFSVEAAPLPLGTLRNSSRISVIDPLLPAGSPLAIDVRAELAGPVCGCPKPAGCTRTQGYWKSKPGVTWPALYSRSAMFFSSGVNWQQILETAPKGGNGYLILAHQYIAAVLNRASGASAPSSVQTVIASAATFLSSGATPDSCAASLCEQQKNWAGILDTYNNGQYPGAPQHCPD